VLGVLATYWKRTKVLGIEEVWLIPPFPVFPGPLTPPVKGYVRLLDSLDPVACPGKNKKKKRKEKKERINSQFFFLTRTEE